MSVYFSGILPLLTSYSSLGTSQPGSSKCLLVPHHQKIIIMKVTKNPREKIETSLFIADLHMHQKPFLRYKAFWEKIKTYKNYPMFGFVCKKSGKGNGGYFWRKTDGKMGNNSWGFTGSPWCTRVAIFSLAELAWSNLLPQTIPGWREMPRRGWGAWGNWCVLIFLGKKTWVEIAIEDWLHPRTLTWIPKIAIFERRYCRF